MSIAIGGAALLVAVGLAAWRIWMLLGWKRRPATVVTVVQSNTRGRYVEVRVTMDDGEVVKAIDESAWKWYAPDQAVNVLLVPDSDPLRVVIPEFLRFSFPCWIPGVMGAWFLYVGLRGGP